MRLFLYITAWAVGSFFMSVGFAGETLDRVWRTRTLVLSSDPEYPPQSFLNENNLMDGFDVEVAREIARELNVKLKVVTPAWEVITAGNWRGRWDISVGSMTPTEARARVLDFPAIYYYVPASFAVHQDSSIQSVAELGGTEIGVCGGCTYEAYLKKELVIDAIGVPEFTFDVEAGSIKTYDTDASAFDDLRLGSGVRLDAVMSALPTIQEAVKGGYPLRVVGEPAYYEPLAVAVDKVDPEFSEKIESIIDKLHKDGTLTRLSVKWYGVDLTKIRNWNG